MTRWMVGDDRTARIRHVADRVTSEHAATLAHSDHEVGKAPETSRASARPTYVDLGRVAPTGLART
ncbi:hypothetical protein GR927_17990 [Mycolicibacterium sp. 3033]|nr:hypothetical protein [Mycolicibacterium aurantiacum]